MRAPSAIPNEGEHEIDEVRMIGSETEHAQRLHERVECHVAGHERKQRRAAGGDLVDVEDKSLNRNLRRLRPAGAVDDRDDGRGGIRAAECRSMRPRDGRRDGARMKHHRRREEAEWLRFATPVDLTFCQSLVKSNIVKSNIDESHRELDGRAKNADREAPL